MTYRRQVAVEFNHCDPAGIVFYPRYFEMTNSVVENFFADRIGMPFARMMAEGHGVPTVRIECDFTRPSRLGDRLDFSLDVEAAGSSSVTFALRADQGSEQRLAARLTLVWVGKAGAEPWPGTIRAALERERMNHG
jgi:4-hydroxybenzoyl-CoA thioesterase